MCQHACIHRYVSFFLASLRTQTYHKRMLHKHSLRLKAWLQNAAAYSRVTAYRSRTTIKRHKGPSLQKLNIQMNTGNFDAELPTARPWVDSATQTTANSTQHDESETDAFNEWTWIHTQTDEDRDRQSRKHKDQESAQSPEGARTEWLHVECHEKRGFEIEVKACCNYWCSVPSEVSCTIAHHMCAGKTKFSYDSKSNIRYLIDATEMTHQAKATKITRKIRFSYPPFMLTKQKWFVPTTKKSVTETCNSTEGCTDPEVHVSEAITNAWNVERRRRVEVDYDTYWWPMPAKVADTILEGMCSGRSKFLYSYEYAQKLGTWSPNGKYTTISRYEVDTATMKQKNRDTHQTREIRFSLGPFQITKQDWSIVEPIET